MSNEAPATAEDEQTIEKLVAKASIALVTTVAEDGSLVSRPLAVQQREFDGDLWFFTKINSPKTTELSRDNEVNLGYCDPSKQHYVSVSGKAEIVRDRAKIEEKWSEGLRTWFPEGKDDPSIALIRVHPAKGEYWDSPSSTVLHLYGYAKAALTGQSPKTEQEKVDLHG